MTPPEPVVLDDEADPETDLLTDPPAERPRGGLRRWTAWLCRRPATFGGLVVGLVFLWLSLTPSLLPRPWFAQGAVSGIAAAFGYGIGSGISALIRRSPASEPSASVKGVAWRTLAGAAVVGTAIVVWLSKHWQNELRRLMGISDEPAYSVLGLMALAVVFFGICMLVARLVRSLSRFTIRQVNRVLPPAASTALGLALAVLLVVGVVSGVLWRQSISLMNSLAGTTNGTTNEGTERPTSRLRSGGEGSLVDWDTLGRQGREFVGRGPSLDDLEEFHGTDDCCREPIRVYVGLDSAPTARARAELAVEELERTGAFERKVLGVFGATGTGWINPRVSSSLEYLHAGDTAEVSIQYSFLPSWLSFLVDQAVASEAGAALIDAVRDHLDGMPEADRPMLLLFGESLGSYATEAAFDDLAEMRAAADGVMLVGPTFTNPIWEDIVADRRDGSPQWRPETDEPGVRFATTPADLADIEALGDGARVVYLQNPSDPITWWSKDLAFRKPDWAGPPAAPDRSPQFRWVPIVTFWQVVFDMTDSLGVPTGHGHHFGSNVADGWVAVSAPDGWTDDDTARLKAVVGERG